MDPYEDADARKQIASELEDFGVGVVSYDAQGATITWDDAVKLRDALREDQERGAAEN